MERVLILLLVLVATGAFSAWWRARDGRVRTRGSNNGRWDGLPIEAADIAGVVAPTTPLTLVQFTAPDCQPCVATRRLLDETAGDRPDVSVTAVDVGDVIELVKAHRIMRAPTTVLISDRGHLLGRVAGLPRAEELQALLDSTRQPQAAA